MEDFLAQIQSSLLPQTNESKLTICYLGEEPLCLVKDSLMKPGGIYHFSDELADLICINITPYSPLLNGIPDPHSDMGVAYRAYMAVPNDDSLITKDARYRRKTSQKQEKNLAKKFSGKMQPGSGAIGTLKGDVITNTFLIEAKYTDKLDYRLKLSIWNKIKKEAHVKDLIPLMEIQLDQDSHPINLIIIDPIDFNDITSLNETAFLNKFFVMPLSSPSESVKLDGELIRQHITFVMNDVPDKFPALILQIGAKMLIALTTEDFLREIDV